MAPDDVDPEDAWVEVRRAGREKGLSAPVAQWTAQCLISNVHPSATKYGLSSRYKHMLNLNSAGKLRRPDRDFLARAYPDAEIEGHRPLHETVRNLDGLHAHVLDPYNYTSPGDQQIEEAALVSFCTTVLQVCRPGLVEGWAESVLRSGLLTDEDVAARVAMSSDSATALGLTSVETLIHFAPDVAAQVARQLRLEGDPDPVLRDALGMAEQATDSDDF